MKRSLLVLGALLALVTGCDGDDPTSPGPVGLFRAAGETGEFTLTTIATGESEDLLAQGAELEIELLADGTTRGRLFVPEGDEDGSDFDADLTGTWMQEGDTITFDHGADTFVRDTEFILEAGRLVSEERFDEVRLRVVLVKV